MFDRFAGRERGEGDFFRATAGLAASVLRGDFFAFLRSCFFARFSSFSIFDWRRSRISREASAWSSALRAARLASLASLRECLSFSLAARAVWRAMRAVRSSDAAFARAASKSFRALINVNDVFIRLLVGDLSAPTSDPSASI